MRSVPRCLMLALAVGLTALAPASAQEPGKAGPAEARKPSKGPLTEDQAADLKYEHYEVTVTTKTYRPYIITHSGEKLIQLEYDTLKAAQARVDEARRDNKILEPEWRDRDFGIETLEHTTTSTVYADALTSTAKALAADASYKPEAGTTHCSEFVRDFAKALTGREVPELRGRAGEQFDALKAAAADPSSKWSSLGFQDDPAAAFRRAQELADEGKLVVVAWKNPNATATDSGHVAAVVPRRGDDPALPHSGSWKLGVPYIAQAGATVSDYLRLSQGFGASKKPGLEVFVLAP